MSGVATVPAWLTVDRAQLRDLHAIAYVRAHRDRSNRATASGTSWNG